MRVGQASTGLLFGLESGLLGPVQEYTHHIVRVRYDALLHQSVSTFQRC